MDNGRLVGAWVRIAIPSTLALMLAACGGSGSGSSLASGGGSGGSSAPSPLVGVWTGYDVESSVSIPVEALIDASGDFDIIRLGTLPNMPADEAQFLGTAAASGTNFPSTSLQGFEPTGGSTFADGSAYGTGTVSGTVNAGSSIQANYSFTTDKSTPYSGALSLTYSANTDTGSSLSAVATSFTDPKNASTYLAIDSSSGAVTGQINILNTTATCNVSGSVSVLNSSYDVYGITLGFSGCSGAYAGLEGATLKGLATLDQSVSPATLLVGVAGQSPGSTNNAIVFYGEE